jgi:hypothetical protein
VPDDMAFYALGVVILAFGLGVGQCLQSVAMLG